MIDEKEIDEAFSSFEKWEPVNDMGEHGIGHGKRAFKEGAHFGYAKAIEQASGGFEEWFNVYMPECDPKLAYNESRAAWTAAKLSSAKEIEELKARIKERAEMLEKCDAYINQRNARIIELGEKVYDMQKKLAEAIEVLEKYASNEFITWLVATQQGMDCDPNKMARDTLDRLKSNGPITSEGK
jgi:tetratricopeptide (TPR) repeat protein